MHPHLGRPLCEFLIPADEFFEHESHVKPPEDNDRPAPATDPDSQDDLRARGECA
jgi:hypothetical protein